MSIFDQLAAPFPNDRIHWRAQTLTRDGSKALALAYLDARDVRQRLNEVVGHENWQVEFYDCGGGKLGCRIGLRIDGEWIWKSDGAGDTQVEAEKGAFSSALKRAAVAWGIGEYLYSMDAVWVPCKTWDKGGKKMFDSFTEDPWKFVRNAPKPDPKREPPPPVDEKAAMASIKEDLKSVQTVADLDVFWASPETQQRVAKLPGKSGAIMAMKDTREIALMLGEAKTLNDLEAVWKEKTGTLEKLNQHMPKWYADLIGRYNDRKAQIADNHQIEHAKGQAA